MGLALNSAERAVLTALGETYPKKIHLHELATKMEPPLDRNELIEAVEGLHTRRLGINECDVRYDEMQPALMHDYSDKGIWAPYEAFYIHAMLFNTRSAVVSIEWVSTALEQISRDLSGDALAQLDRRAMLGEFQNIIVQAAALSRYFWPARQGHEARAKQLRAAFDVADDNPLKNRDLRNEIEHFDEKLDAYLSDGIAGYTLPEFVGTLPESDGVTTHIFRAYYLEDGLFEILGKRYEIEPLAHEILRLHDRLLLADRNGGRFGDS